MMAIAIFCHSMFRADQAITFVWVAFTAIVTGWCAFVGSIIHPLRQAEVKIRIAELRFITVVHIGVLVGLAFLALQILSTNGFSMWILAASVTAATLFYIASSYSLFCVWRR
jgi:hypothetical protein